MRNRRLVRTLGAQRVVHVHHLQNARQQGDIGAFERVRISRAIPVLVMVANDGQHVAKGAQRFHDVLADDGMLAHDLPLIGCKVRALAQDLVGHGNFADIVQIAAALQCHDVFMVE